MAGPAGGDAGYPDRPDEAAGPGARSKQPGVTHVGRPTDNVRPHHLERKALLYVQQSSAHQVRHNRESSALQYAMRGWSEIEVIDDDLGRTAAGGVQRAGFERCRSLPPQGRRRLFGFAPPAQDHEIHDTRAEALLQHEHLPSPATAGTGS
jgi:hypothetical protein